MLVQRRHYTGGLDSSACLFAVPEANEIRESQECCCLPTAMLASVIAVAARIAVGL